MRMPAALKIGESVDLVDRLQRVVAILVHAEFDERDELLGRIEARKIFDQGHALAIKDGALPARWIIGGGDKLIQGKRGPGSQGVMEIAQMPGSFVLRVVQQRKTLLGPSRRCCIRKELGKENMRQFVRQG